MNERELYILNKCIETVNLKPAEIEDYISMCKKLNDILTNYNGEEKTCS